jgi:hypothetical protein
MLFVVMALIMGASLYMPLSNMPSYMAASRRMKASNQMVLCVFYVVTYMRHTSNLENAIEFASEHIGDPLALDLRKVMWDVETEKYESVKESLAAYLDTWRDYNMEFVEAFNLIVSSLLEGEESRRLASLDKSLDVMLDETYEKMLHYAHNLKGPITMLHMLGVILPILGLVILPLVVSFMEGVSWVHLFFFYNILIPFGVYGMGRSILSKRPTGYGDSGDAENNPALQKYKNIIINLGFGEIKINPLYVSIFLFLTLFIIGIAPVVIHSINPAFEYPPDPKADYHLMEYKTNAAGDIVGPFGLGSTVLSIGIPLAFGLGAGLFFKLRSQNIIKFRKETQKLEEEFASALFH